MSNHSSDIPPELRQKFAEMFKEVQPENFVGAEKEALISQFVNNEIGRTGRYPEGKLHQRDEGEIAFAVGTQQDKVILNFGTPVTWVGMPAQNAIELGRLLIKHGMNLL